MAVRSPHRQYSVSPPDASRYNSDTRPSNDRRYRLGRLTTMRTRSIAIISLAITGVGLCSLGWSATPGTVSTPTRQNGDGDWRIELHVSGGVVGLDRMLDLRGTGALNASDRQRGVNVSANANDEDLMRVSVLLRNVESEVTIADTRCRDCTQYEIRILIGGRPLVSRLNDVNRGSSRFEELLQILTRLLDDTLQMAG